MSSIEEHYMSENRRLTKIIDLQKKVISNQEEMIKTKTNIIGLLREQKELLIRALNDIKNHLEKTA